MEEAKMTGLARKTLTETIVGWLRDRSIGRDQQAELDHIEAPELERMARDLGVTPSELRALAGRGPHAADLLLERMAFAGLDPVAFAEAEPASFRDLQRLCATCGSKGECARDLASPLTSEALPGYCVNRDTLRALGAIER